MSYSVKYQNLQSCSNQIVDIGNSVSSIESRLTQVAAAMNYRSSAMDIIKKDVNKMSGKIALCSKTVVAYGDTLSKLNSRYLSAECSIYDMLLKAVTSAQNSTTSQNTPHFVLSPIHPNICVLVKSVLTPLFGQELENLLPYMRTGYSLINDIYRAYVKINGIVDSMFDMGISANFERSGSAASYSREFDNGWSSGNVSADFLSRSFDTGITAKLFGDDADGNKILNPSIDAFVGVSASLFMAEASATVGREYLGLHSSVGLNVMSADANAGIKAGLLDSDGKINPNIKAGADLEATLVEANVTAGGSIAGTTVDVTGSVNVGIGAHADVEIGGGKIKCDIGASFGIGASIDFEVDFSGTINAVCDYAHSAWEDLGALLF